MAIQQKNSNTSDAVPNLTYGEVAVNNTDDVLWVRAEGKRTPIHLDAVRKRALPYEGQIGAPLGYKGSASIWDTALAPNSEVNGAIQVDLPPAAGVFAVPGVMLSSTLTDRGVGANVVQVEPFQVRSDEITVTALAFAIRSGSPASVRVGIFDADDNMIVDELVTAPTVGGNTVSVSVVLPRGSYKAMLWTSGLVTWGMAQGLQPEQGWRISGSSLNFARAYEGTADQSAGLAPIAAAARLSTTPGVDKTVLMRWTL